MKLSVAVGALMLYPVRTTLAMARRAGFDAAELMLTPTILRRGPERYVKAARDIGIEITSAHARLHYTRVSLEAKIRSDRDSILFASRLPDCSCVVLHYPMSVSGDLSSARQWLDALCRVRDEASPNLMLAIENRAENYDGSPRQQLDNFERLRMIASEWDVHITLDIAHAVSTGVSPSTAIDAVAPRLANVHLSDATSARYRGGILNGLFRDHRAPGTGTIDMRAVSDRLREAAYTGLVTLELSPVSLRSPWPAAAERVLAALRESLTAEGFTTSVDETAGRPGQRQTL